jgi:uncharacterized protein
MKIKQREIARKGGESVPDEKRSFAKDHELASGRGARVDKASRASSKLRRREAADQKLTPIAESKVNFEAAQ